MAQEDKQDFEKTTVIDGYDILLHGEWDGDDFVTWCHVSFMNKAGSSLGVLSDYSTIENDDGTGRKVRQSTITKIERWADENGY